LDYRRFRVWLKEKYFVERAYLFIGLMPKHRDLYTYLQEAGFTLVFKEITYDGQGNVKGNCDADLVLAAVRDAYESSFTKLVLVSCDGDYAGLVKFLMEKNKFKTILSPNNKNKLSILLKRTGAPIAYLDNQKSILDALKEKAPDADGTA
jgi:uncharacterized LabA/DUF88 family protein